MSKFNITLAVPAAALPSLITDLSEYDAELVRVENAEEAAPRALPAPATVEELFADEPLSNVAPIERRPEASGARQTTAWEVYSVVQQLYDVTHATFRSSDVWHAMRARGVNVTKRSVYGHLQRFRIMGLLRSVAGGRGRGGHWNIVLRNVTEAEFDELYRELIAA